MKETVLTQIEVVDEPQRRLRALDFGHRHRAVERDDWARLERQELVIELEDLRPVRRGRGRRSAVDGVDRGLELVRSGPVEPQALAHDSLAVGDQRAIPAAAVLVDQQHEVTIRGGARHAARLDEQHEPEQPERLGLVGHELRQ
jgi:hypothetical protein